MELQKQKGEALSPNALRLMRLTTGIKTLILFALFAVAGGVTLGKGHTVAGIVLLTAGAAVCLIYWLLMPRFRFRRYRYLLTQDRLEITEGVLFVHRTVVPVDRIHQIEVSRGPLDSLCGVACVEVTTAGGTAKLKFLDAQKADAVAALLHSRLQARIGAAQEGSDV